MAFTKQQLKDELLNDPMTLGYASLIASNDDIGLANLLNDKTLGGNIDRTYVSAAELQSCVVATEAIGLTSQQAALWQAILTAAANGGVLLSDQEVRSQILAVFTTTGAGSTRNKIAAIQTRSASRAEALWGENITVSYAQVSDALRN